MLRMCNLLAYYRAVLQYSGGKEIFGTRFEMQNTEDAVPTREANQHSRVELNTVS